MPISKIKIFFVFFREYRSDQVKTVFIIESLAKALVRDERVRSQYVYHTYIYLFKNLNCFFVLLQRYANSPEPRIRALSIPVNKTAVITELEMAGAMVYESVDAKCKKTIIIMIMFIN